MVDSWLLKIVKESTLRCGIKGYCASYYEIQNYEELKLLQCDKVDDCYIVGVKMHGTTIRHFHNEFYMRVHRKGGKSTAKL